MSAARVLVTGAGGFTGRHLAIAAASRQVECIGVVYADAGDIPGYASIRQCDITDRDTLTALIRELSPDYVVHLAGIAFVAHGSSRQIYDTNLWGTVCLLDVLAESCPQVRRVLVASSGNVYGDDQAVPIDETAVPAPANDYGVSKLAMEYACRLRMDRIPIVITRPFNYTGVGQDSNFLIPKMVDAFRNRQPVLELGNLDVERDFSDVRDVVDAYLELLTGDHDAGTYNVCSGQPTALKAVIEQLQSLTGHEIEVRVNPAFVRANEIKVLYGNRSRLDAAIGPRNLHSLEQTLQWMLAEGA
jgi:nucleoside-diphosphate-sugar epimerase